MMVKNTICAIGALMLCAGAANATMYEWEWDRGDPGNYGINDGGGQWDSVRATFDSTTKRLSWSVSFSNDVTEGFTLALNDGPNPKNHPGELALLYVDARDANDMIITAYGYNGQNNNRSYRDGDASVGGDQTPDLIMNANQRAEWILSSSVEDDMGGGRTISFEVDASDIVGHTPLYPDAQDPWHGIGFAEQLGLWMHPYRNFDPTYDEQTGAITNLSASGEGWFDGRDFTTSILVPTPGAMALFAGAGFCTLRRRRA